MDELENVGAIWFNLYYELNGIWDACSGRVHYGLNPKTLAERSGTQFLSMLLEERKFLLNLPSLINSKDLVSIIEQAIELVGKMDDIQSMGNFLNESNYCKRHTQAIKEIINDLIRQKGGIRNEYESG